MAPSLAWPGMSFIVNQLELLSCYCLLHPRIPVVETKSASSSCRSLQHSQERVSRILSSVWQSVARRFEQGQKGTEIMCDNDLSPDYDCTLPSMSLRASPSPELYPPSARERGVSSLVEYTYIRC